MSEKSSISIDEIVDGNSFLNFCTFFSTLTTYISANLQTTLNKENKIEII